ncbi:MAG TPA: hypothetical protein VK559_00330, partial [Ferruginibacter sp.]|nr:hypothetical protein [Ferruginibacter sp.]
MSRIVVLHFSPLELYPPIQNFLRGLSASNTSKEIYVLTTQTKLGALPKFTSDSEKIKIIRLGISAQKLNSFRRYSSYLFFYLGSIIFLLWKRPSAVLYYETISSYPAYLYKRFFNSKARIFIHYHEYTSTEEYSNGMKLNRYFHKHEKYLYPMAEWVSQTNEYRMQKFIKNLSSVTVANPRILPNYPPANWH